MTERSTKTPPTVIRVSAQKVEDGTTQLLRWGGSMVGVGVLAAVLLKTVLGGFTPSGATTNEGWLALIVALMCLPFGGLLLTLGIAKWFRNRSLARRK